jgi:hypothetical protein
MEAAMALRGPIRMALGAATFAAGVSILAGAPVGAATTTIAATGATITRTDSTAGTTITVKATVHRLDLWCSSNRLVVNKKATSVPCNRLLSVTTIGLLGDDTVEINATGFGSSLPTTSLAVKTGSGNDTIIVRHRSTFTAYAGAGNDVVRSGFAAGDRAVAQTLRGDDGNDTLTSLGQITPRPPVGPHEVDDPPDDRSTLDGGSGADRFTSAGSPGNVSVLADMDDSVETPTNLVRLSTGDANDQVLLHHEWLKGTTITAKRGTTASKTLALTQYLQRLVVDTQAGNDAITLDGDSPNWSSLSLIGGNGTDSAAFRLTEVCEHDPAKRTVSCNSHVASYAADIESVRFTPFRG